MMNANPPLSLTPREVARLLVTQRKLWVIPAVTCGILAAAYSLVMPRYWDASQALVVRQETAASQGPTPGKFADLYEMRTMQETILEVAKSREVVVATIKAVDQRTAGGANEPTAEEIEEFRKRLKMLPPDGGEFGKTEVFYFSLKDRSRDRAIALVGELCRQLDTALKQLRAKRAEGLIAELEEQVGLASEIHSQETKRLAEFEAEVGADLGELRMLHSAASGQSDLRQEVVQLEGDARRFATQLREAEQLLAMLREAEKDPQQLLATPNSLLTSQPALRRLKDGLVDAQLATARLGGTRSADHPRVKAAVESEKEIREDLHRELLTAIQGADGEVKLSRQRLEATGARLADVQGRLDRLAERRAEYSNRVAAVDNSRVTLDRARQNLSTAKAAEAAARSGSLVTRIDSPETGPYPAGLGRTMVTAAGGLGGLMLGLGLVFLTAGTPPTDNNVGGVREVDNSEPSLADSAATQVGRPARRVEDRLRTAARNVSSQELSEPAEVDRPVLNQWQFAASPAELAAFTETLPSQPAAVAARSNIEAPSTVKAPTAVSAADDAAAQVSGAAAEQNAAGNQPAPSAPALVAPAAPPQPQRKTILPGAVGTLPAGQAVLPPLGTPAGMGGMSLQDAIMAARQAQR